MEEEEVNSVRSLDARVIHNWADWDPFELCPSDARRESLSPKGDVQSCPTEERGERLEEESTVVEEVARSKEVVSEPV